MEISLPRDLFPQIHADDDVNPASRRKMVLPRVTQAILEAQGYEFKSKIPVPGGYAFNVVDPDGKKLKLGLKTAVNRWLNTSNILVERVDAVIITTFAWDAADEKPEALQLVRISSSDLLARIDQVRKEAKKRKWDWSPNFYMPLDPENIDPDGGVGCVGKALLEIGTVIFGPQRVKWVKATLGSIQDTAITTDAKPSSVDGVTASFGGAIDTAREIVLAKAALADRLKISPEKIEILVRY